MPISVFWEKKQIKTENGKSSIHSIYLVIISWISYVGINEKIKGINKSNK